MEELLENASTLVVNRCRDPLPGFDLVFLMYRGTPKSTNTFGRNMCGFGNDQAGTGSLTVVGDYSL